MQHEASSQKGWRPDVPTDRANVPRLRIASGDDLSVVGAKMVIVTIGTGAGIVPMVECSVQRAVFSTNTLAFIELVTAFGKIRGIC